MLLLSMMDDGWDWPLAKVNKVEVNKETNKKNENIFFDMGIVNILISPLKIFEGCQIKINLKYLKTNKM